MNFEPNQTPPTTNNPTEETKATEPVVKVRRPRGFAAMDRSKVSEIASKGGKAAHAAGTAHQFTSDEARQAGKKGGVAPHVRRGRGPRQSATVPAAEPSSGVKEEAKSA
ncbi:MAG: KGG domain-containing protein [Labilithrix sp.]